MATETIEKIYQYRNIDGSVAHETIRYYPKSFRQRRPDGNGGYIWSLAGCETVLYRLPEITEAIKRHEPVFILEGEKDVESAVKLGLQATTSPMGANKWADSYSVSLYGAVAFICPDNDLAGMKHAFQVANAIWEYCELVKIVRLPGPGKDLTDFVEAGGTADQLKALCDEAEIYLPADLVIYYHDRFRNAKTSELYEYLGWLKEINQAKYTGVVEILQREFEYRVKALETNSHRNKYYALIGETK
jgi:DNA primase